jgi:hypothetical protein
MQNDGDWYSLLDAQPHQYFYFMFYDIALRESNCIRKDMIYPVKLLKYQYFYSILY